VVLRGGRRELIPVPRDRDASGRAVNARPRDRLGRPLAPDAVGVAREPEGVVRSPAESLSSAQLLLDDGLPFHAHEVLETAWKAAPPDERELWRGLAQLAVGLTHLSRGNLRGASNLIERGAASIAPYPVPAPHGVDTVALVAWATEAVTSLSAPPPLPRLVVGRIDR
jgi:hypothetical protein